MSQKISVNSVSKTSKGSNKSLITNQTPIADFKENSIEKYLVNAAMKAKSTAYAPYSKSPIGAALLIGEKEIITGANVECSSYGLSCCAEKCAVMKAVSKGFKEYRGLALAINSDSFVWPCGACLQIMAEFCSNDFPIYSLNSKRMVQHSSLYLLYPRQFHL